MIRYRIGMALFFMAAVPMAATLIAAAIAQVQTTNPTGKVSVGTVAGAPTCNAASEGTFYGVTDALAPTVLTAVVGGGAVHTLTYCNGTSWIVG